jgi:hypothetical protein
MFMKGSLFYLVLCIQMKVVNGAQCKCVSSPELISLENAVD